MKTPKAITDRWLEIRNSGDYHSSMATWLVARFPLIREELVHMRNAMDYKDIKLTRAKIGKLLCECHLALYCLQMHYSFMDKEYEEICEKVLEAEGIEEKVEAVAEVLEESEESYEEMEF